MCGLVAMVSTTGEVASPAVVERMLAPIVHRGPDDFGTVFNGPVGLGFRRLSILDLSPLGHQPMHSADGNCTIVFNGEIYNFIELRSELEDLGHRFRSTGDTEVLLTAYQQWGVACLERLNGMWAFVIHDRARNLLFGSRDRFGIKPLYRWQGPRETLFASEIKSIRASGLYRGGMNMRVCAAFLYQVKLDESRESFFEGIVQVPAGHAFELKFDGGYREWAWWRLEDIGRADHPDPPGEFAELFEDAMRLHIRSDVPVGVSLSGGLDSTSILCATARLRKAAGANTPLMAFCYLDKAFDEDRYIADTLEQTGAQAVTLRLGPEQLWDSMPAVLAAQDEPVHAMSALIGYHLMRLAASHGVKVVLNGQGADEVLGGYSTYFEARWFELARQGRLLHAWREIAEFTESHGGNAGDRVRNAMTQALRSVMRKVAASQLDRLSAARNRAAIGRCDWLSPELRQYLFESKTQPSVTLDVRHALIHSVNRASLPLYLRLEDRNSMAHSVEARVPFLDHRLVSLAFSLGSEWKVRGRWNKYLLRQAMKGRIPDSVRLRVDKVGFSTSSGEWFRGPLKERLLDVLHDPSFRQSGFYRVDEFDKLLQAHQSGTQTHTGKLLVAVLFHVWRQQIG